jgi:hypothetical protein
MYKVGDKVQIKSREWFEKNKINVKEGGFNISKTNIFFNKNMLEFCGKTLEVVGVDVESSEKVYILNTDYDWIWSPLFLIGLKELRKKKLKKLKKLKKQMYKVGDKVQIKSREWFEENKTICRTDGFYIPKTNIFVNKNMLEFCGKTLEIIENTYANTEKGTEMVIEKAYVLNTNDDYDWIWYPLFLIGLKKLRKKKLKN